MVTLLYLFLFLPLPCLACPCPCLTALAHPGPFSPLSPLTHLPLPYSKCENQQNWQNSGIGKIQQNSKIGKIGSISKIGSTSFHLSKGSLPPTISTTILLSGSETYFNPVSQFFIFLPMTFFFENSYCQTDCPITFFLGQKIETRPNYLRYTPLFFYKNA